MIDIRQLHIGAHVECEGKRARIEQISTIHLADEPMEVFLRCSDGLALVAPLDEIKPIPITPELLADLGFENRSLVKWHSPSWMLKVDDYAVIFQKKPSGELWKVSCIKGGMDCGFCVCRYLHEAEAFLALHNVELIND